MDKTREHRVGRGRRVVGSDVGWVEDVPGVGA